MRNLFTGDENRKSMKLLQKMQQQEDFAYEQELLRRREQELNDEAIARELQSQLDTDPNSSSSETGHSSSNNSYSPSPPPLPNKPLAYSSFDSDTCLFGNSIRNTRSNSQYESQPGPSSPYTSTHSFPPHLPSRANTMPTTIPASTLNTAPTFARHGHMLNSMPTPISSSVPAYTATSVPISMSNVPVSSSIPPPSVRPSSRPMPMPSPTSASDPPTPMPPDSLLSKNSSSIPPFRIIRRAETQPIPSSTHFNNGAMNTMNGPTLYPATPRQSNPSLHPIESIPINTNAYESPTILSETPPDGLMQRRSSTFSDSFLSLKPNQHEDPFSDLFAYEDIPNKEEKTQVQDTSRHKKSVSEPPNLSRPQVANDNYGYYKQDVKTDLPVPTNNDERHITVASINPGLRAWIRIHPRDTGKDLAERIHVIASYKTQKVVRLTTQSGRAIPLDNTPIFKDWDEIKEFKEGEPWKVEWGPMPSYVDIITEGKQFMRQLKQSFKT